MAGKREIATRFKLEGEAEYRRAMTDAANALKVLDSEQKLAKAQFEQTGDAEAYAAEQARILQEKITEQQRAVSAAEAALKQLKANGVDPTDRSYQTWQKKLNNANTSLTNMQTELGKVQNGMDDTGKAAETMGETLTVIDPETRFQNTLKAVEDMRDRLNGLISKAVQAGKALWDMSVDAGHWADDLFTASSQAGIDVETYQAWQYASRFIDTSVDDIAKSVKKLQADLGSTSEETVKVFNQLGVVTRNADGSVRDATAVFWDVVDALGRVEDATTRGIYAQKLLGSHYNSLNPLIEAGSQAYKEMADKGREVAVVSEENVKALGKTDDVMQELDASLQKAKFDTLAAIAPTIQQVGEGLSTAVQAFNEFVNSDEGQAALSELNTALSDLITSFLGEDNGKGTFQSIVEGAKGAVSDFTGALTWIKDHGDTVKAIIEGMGIAWAALNVAPPVMQFMRLLNITPLSKLNALFGGSSSGGSSSGGSSGGGGASRTAGVMGLALKALPVAAGAYIALKPGEGDAQQDSWYYNGQVTEAGRQYGFPETEAEYRSLSEEERTKLEESTYWTGWDERTESGKDAPKKTVQGKDAMGVPLAELAELAAAAAASAAETAYSSPWTPAIPENALVLNKEEASQTGRELGEAYAAGVREALSEIGSVTADGSGNLYGQLKDKLLTDFYPWLNDEIQSPLLDAVYENISDGTREWLDRAVDEAMEGRLDPYDFVDLVARIEDDLEKALAALSDGGETQKSGQEMGKNVTEAAEQEMSFLETVGQDAATKLANGIAENESSAVQAARHMGDQIIAEINSALDQVAAMTGGMRGAGGGYVPTLGTYSPVYSGASGGSVTAVIQMDKTVVGKMVAPIVNTQMAATIEQRD